MKNMDLGDTVIDVTNYSIVLVAFVFEEWMSCMKRLSTFPCETLIYIQEI